MFREMLRKKQLLTQEECLAILKNEPRGVLSVLGDDGYPYGMPMNHFYCEADGKIYFHGGRKGHLCLRPGVPQGGRLGAEHQIRHCVRTY